MASVSDMPHCPVCGDDLEVHISGYVCYTCRQILTPQFIRGAAHIHKKRDGCDQTRR